MLALHARLAESHQRYRQQQGCRIHEQVAPWSTCKQQIGQPGKRGYGECRNCRHSRRHSDSRPDCHNGDQMWIGLP